MRRAAQLLSLSIALLAAPTASAETPTEKARRLYELGNEAYKIGDAKNALRFYEEAFAAERSFGIALNLGSVELDLGRHRDAAEHLAYALRIGATGIGQKIRAAAEQKLATAKGRVGALQIAGGAGCALTIDGATPTDPDAAELFVEPGEHTVAATCPGERRTSVKVTAEAGKLAAVALRFGGDAPPPPPPPPPPPRARSDGDATVAITAAVGGGLAGVGAVVGAVLLGLGADESASADRQLATLKAGGGCASDLSLCKSIDGHRRASDDLNNAGIGALVGGVVVGAAIVVVGLAVAPKRTSPRAWIQPSGAGLRVSF